MKSIDEYIAKRVNDQIEWYDKKSQDAQNRYKFSQLIEICAAALIPLLSSYTANCRKMALLVGILGCIITAIEGMERLFKWHEMWIEYRTTCELLKYHLNLYLTHTGPYNDDSESYENRFIRNIEDIIASENSKWKILNETKKDTIKGKPITEDENTGT